MNPNFDAQHNLDSYTLGLKTESGSVEDTWWAGEDPESNVWGNLGEKLADEMVAEAQKKQAQDELAKAGEEIDPSELDELAAELLLQGLTGSQIAAIAKGVATPATKAAVSKAKKAIKSRKAKKAITQITTPVVRAGVKTAIPWWVWAGGAAFLVYMVTKD
jgi:hypothetical protein